MKVMSALLLLVNFVVSVNALKIEANYGEDVTLNIPMDKVEEANLLKITFTSETTKDTRLIAENCTGSERCNVTKTPGVKLRVEQGRVSVIIQKVNSSRSGIYKVEAIIGNEVTEAKAALVVKEAPVSSSAAPPHSPTPKPLTSDLHWLWLVFGFGFAIVILVVVCFWKYRTNPESANERERVENQLNV